MHCNDSATHVSWFSLHGRDSDSITLDGEFTVPQLEAIAVFLKAKSHDREEAITDMQLSAIGLK